ncbi:membrane protein [Salmonella enterica subsp. enterica serovar Goldcoast]|nr:membrane protein [Salmonella enterica subsp. enterica serovar Goldcoast]
MLKSPLLWKMITLGGAMILLLIPLMMVRHTIVERADYRSHVEAAIRQSTSGPQKGCRPAGGGSGDRALYRAGRGERGPV